MNFISVTFVSHFVIRSLILIVHFATALFGRDRSEKPEVRRNQRVDGLVADSPLGRPTSFRELRWPSPTRITINEQLITKYWG